MSYRIRVVNWIWLLVAALFILQLPAQTLRVMTFNVRYAGANDGEDRWELRRDLLVGAIREKDPDLIGTQELLNEQGQYIVEKAPGYVWFGISRRGNHEDEHMGVFYKKDKFQNLQGTPTGRSELPNGSSFGLSIGKFKCGITPASLQLSPWEPACDLSPSAGTCICRPAGKQSCAFCELQKRDAVH